MADDILRLPSVGGMASQFHLQPHPGYCACCRSSTTFAAVGSWLRDQYICSSCGSIPRQRHLQHVLDSLFPRWPTLTIHESSPSHDFIERYAEDYSSSQLLPGVRTGEERDGVRCENVEALTFPAESIDIFITQDVLEHVFDPAAAIRDIHRVLKPGGAHVFTAPRHLGLQTTLQRARLVDGVVEHLQPEEYHGSPVGDNRALVTFDYGTDLEALLSLWSGGSVETVNTVDLDRGLDAQHNEVFVIRKPVPSSYAALPPFRAALRDFAADGGRLSKRFAAGLARRIRSGLPSRSGVRR